MEGKLALVIDEDFEGIAHELAADILHVLRHGGREHHHLLLRRGSLENRLHVSSHIYFFEHLVALIEDEDLEIAEIEVTLLDESEDTPWGANNDMRLLNSLEESDVLANGDTAIYYLGAQLGKLLLESVELLLNLISKLSIVAENESRARLRVLRELMKDGEHEYCGFSHS